MLGITRHGLFLGLRANYLLRIVSMALLFTPFEVALILTRRFLFVVAVAMLNEADRAPAGTLSSVTEPIELEPPTTLFGSKVSAESTACAAAVTLSVADLLTAA